MNMDNNTLLLTDGIVKSIDQDDIDYDELKNACKRPLEWFFRKYAEHVVDGKKGRHIYIQHENAKVLAVAHADTVINPRKTFSFNIINRRIQDGTIVRMVKTPTLDDRLGIYTIMSLLPSIFGGEWADILITEGEETGNSTAADFVTDKEYNWIVEFDRTGSSMTGQGKYSKNSDAVLYEYKGAGKFEDALTECGFENLGRGSFTDISLLQELKCKAFNVAVGYHDNHSTKAYMFPIEYARTITMFMEFYKKYNDTKFSHVKVKSYKSSGYTYKNTYDWNAHDSRNRTANYVGTGWMSDAKYKPGDLVSYEPLRNDRVFIIDTAHKTKQNLYVYDVAHVTGHPYLYNIDEWRLFKDDTTCYYCIMKTESPIAVSDTSESSINLCPECYSNIIGEFVSCDFCNIEYYIDEVMPIGSGYMSCTACADEVFGNDDHPLSEHYIKDTPYLILPGDVVRHRAGGIREFEVTAVDNGHQLFLTYIDGNGQEVQYINGGYGFEPTNFEFVRRVRI